MRNFSNINENLDITTKEYVDKKANLEGGNTFSGTQIFQNSNSGAVAECVINDSAYDSFTVRSISDHTQKSAISAGYLWCQSSDTIYSSLRPTGIYFGDDDKSIEGTLLFPSTLANGAQKTIATTDQIPDVSGKANLEGGNSFKGTQTITEATSGGYSINASGYIKGSWLQSSTMHRYASNTGKICVFDGVGWIYYRTPADILSDAGGATLTGANNFTGANTFSDNNISFVSQSGQTIINGSDVLVQAVGEMGSAELSVKTDNGNKVFEVISDAESGAIHLNSMINIDNEQQGDVPLCIGGTNAGTSGQVLTSQGDNKTPIWSTPAISAATLTGSTLYLTIDNATAQTSAISEMAVYNDIY